MFIAREKKLGTFTVQLQESIVYLNKVITRVVARVKLAERIAWLPSIRIPRNYIRTVGYKIIRPLNIHFTFKTIKSNGIR